MSCNDNYTSNCVCDVVSFINEMQDAVTDSNFCPTGCSNPILGANCGTTSPLANTRPFVLFDKCSDIFLPASCFNILDPTGTAAFALPIPVPSPFLRVESVDECCAVLRVLAPDVTDLSTEAVLDLIAELELFLPGGNGSTKADFEAIARTLICKYQNGITTRQGGPSGPSKLITEYFGLTATNFCITVDLKCYCAIQCLRDGHVSGL